MKISKIRIKNLFGITEYEATGKDVELLGQNGAGKTSIIDSIRLALTNSSNRDVIVKQGANEGEVLIEIDDGINILRKKRAGKADYVSVKDKDGQSVSKVETFLRTLFTSIQLSPIEFIALDSKEQNRIILDLIDFKWDLEWIKEQFGELPQKVNYQQNILRVLYDIQSIQGDYYLRREGLNRDIRNKKASIEDIGKTLPAGYDAHKWRNKDLLEIHEQIRIATNKNKEIEADKLKLASIDSQITKENEIKEKSVNTLRERVSVTVDALSVDIEDIKNQIDKLTKQIANKQEEKNLMLARGDENFKGIEETHQKKVQEILDIQKQLNAKVVASAPVDISPLLEEAETIEQMKGFLNEYSRMIVLQGEVEQIKESSEELTSKIKKARTLPAEILKQCTIPVAGLTVVDGEPRINGLPISNLSDGEKLLLCVDIANEKKNALNLLLIDGVEKLCTENRNALYAKCKSKGVQFIATRTTDDPELTIIEI